MATRVCVLDGGDPKDSENTLNSFLTKRDGNAFWQIGADMYVPVDLSSSPLPWHGAVYRWRGYWTPVMGASGPWRRRWDSVAKGPSSDSKPRIKGQFFSKVSRCVSDIFQNKNCRACRFLPPLFKKICLIVFNSIEVLQTVDDDFGLIPWYKREESVISLVTIPSMLELISF